MSNAETPFKPDLSRKLYTIRIEVYPNANIFAIGDKDETFDLTFQHIIGALEIVKGAYVREQGARVQAAYNEKPASE